MSDVTFIFYQFNLRCNWTLAQENAALLFLLSETMGFFSSCMSLQKIIFFGLSYVV